MADLEADVLPAIAALIDQVVYPNGDSNAPAVTLPATLSSSVLAGTTLLTLPTDPGVGPGTFITFGDASPETVQVASTYVPPAPAVPPATSTVVPLVAGVVYAHSSGAPLTIGNEIKIYPGHPSSKNLDDDLKNSISHVSVFSPGGGGGATVQVLEDPQVITAPVHTITAALSGSQSLQSNSLGATFGNGVLTFSGTVSAGELVTLTIDHGASFSYTILPSDNLNSLASTFAALIAANPLYVGARANGQTVAIPRASFVAVQTLTGNTVTLGGSVTVGQYVTVVLDNRAAFSYAAVQGDTLATMATALANLIKAQSPYGATSATGPALTIAGAAYLTVRIGASAKMGKLEHRTNVPVRVMIWAPTEAARSAIAALIDPYLQENFRMSFADTSQGLLHYQMTSVDDVPEKANLFRRDLVYTAEYGAVYTFPAFEVTSIDITLDPGVNRLTQVVQ